MDNSSKKSDFATTTLASEVDHATPSSSYFSAVEEQIERSKAHWSMLADHSGGKDEEEVDFAVSNEQEFKALQSHPTWGFFFANFSGDGKSTSMDDVLGELVVGEKFAEGGQAEIYDVQIKWIDRSRTKEDERHGWEYVLKVFKEGTLLKHVKSQLPEGLLQYRVELMENLMSLTPRPELWHTSQVHCGVLLKGGRFAFLIGKLHFDLRTLIEHNMILGGGEDYGPFSKDEGAAIMYNVALGVNLLHNRDIVHRDLKAANVLVDAPSLYRSGWAKWYVLVADYECSIGVVGTNFFRAPEILQACKERKVNERPEVFSRAADVYSYGMTCYEILTGKLPFEDHPLSDNPSLLIDLVINQHLRPEVPKYVDDWSRKLLDGCWQFDPTARPRIGEILNEISTNSVVARILEVELNEKYGEYFRS